MGIDLLTAKFLAFANTLDVDFSNTGTLGRQSLYVERRDVIALFRKFQLRLDDATVDAMFKWSSSGEESIGFAEGFFGALGADNVEAIDASDYEGASLIHDMNRPIPAQHQSRFSVMFDGGTLEHVFNFPVAIENCMRMLRTGGHFISVAPANNYFGHGFYQFSSELFFRVFSEDNGFRVKRVFLSAEKSFGAWYEVPDPEQIRERIALRNQVPTLQLFIAEKISDDAGIHVCPQQSDYSAILWQGHDENWTAHGDASLNRRTAIYRKAMKLLPRSAAQYSARPQADCDRSGHAAVPQR